MIYNSEPANFRQDCEVVSVFIEHEGQVLFLLRQDHKPQGNLWAMVAGKVEKGESLLQALVREVEEEIGLKTAESDYQFFNKFYVKYSDLNYIYHIYHLSVAVKPVLNLDKKENKEYAWLTPAEALKLDLIEDEDICIKSFFNL